MKLRNSIRIIKVIGLAVSICAVISLVWAASTYQSLKCEAKRDGKLLVLFSYFQPDVATNMYSQRWPGLPYYLRHYLQRSPGYYLVDLNGCRTNLSEKLEARNLGKPTWSPTGNHLAFLLPVNKDNHWQWFLVNLDIATLIAQKYPLQQDGEARLLTWSTNDTTLLFLWALDDSKPNEIWQFDLATKQMKQLSQLPMGVTEVSWSPDRFQVAFTIPSNSGSECQKLYIQNVDGTAREMLHECASSNELVWSSNGRFIAFEVYSEISEPDQLCWIPVVGGEAVCSQPGHIGHFAWSYDSKRIAFSSYNGIDVVDRQTNEVTNLVSIDRAAGEGTAYHLNWSPDGKYLAYARCDYAEAVQTCKVHVLDIIDGKSWRLTSIYDADDFPIWSPATLVQD